MSGERTQRAFELGATRADGLLVSILSRPLAIAAGLRDAATFEQATDSTARVCEAAAARLGLYSMRFDRYSCQYAERGGGGSAGGGGGDRFTVAVGRTEAACQQVAELTLRSAAARDPAQRRDLGRALGTLLGIPTCCTAAWIRWDRMGVRGNFTVPVAAATPGPWLTECNIRPPARLVEHIPCSFSCAATAAIGRRVIDEIVADPDRVNALLGREISAGAILGLTTTDIDRIYARPLQDRKDSLLATLAAPMLYVDFSRYVVFIGGSAEPLRQPAAGTSTTTLAWRVTGVPVASRALIGELHAAEDHLLHQELETDLVNHLAAAARHGALHITRDGPPVTGITRIEGHELEVSASAAKLLLLPFGAPID